MWCLEVNYVRSFQKLGKQFQNGRDPTNHQTHREMAYLFSGVVDQDSSFAYHLRIIESVDSDGALKHKFGLLQYSKADHRWLSAPNAQHYVPVDIWPKLVAMAGVVEPFIIRGTTTNVTSGATNPMAPVVKDTTPKVTPARDDSSQTKVLKRGPGRPRKSDKEQEQQCAIAKVTPAKDKRAKHPKSVAADGLRKKKLKAVALPDGTNLRIVAEDEVGRAVDDERAMSMN
jgi:hypothetical protein